MKKVVPYKNLPAKLPIAPTIVVYLLLAHLSEHHVLGDTVQIVVATILWLWIAVGWIVEIVNAVNQVEYSPYGLKGGE